MGMVLLSAVACICETSHFCPSTRLALSLVHWGFKDMCARFAARFAKEMDKTTQRRSLGSKIRYPSRQLSEMTYVYLHARLEEAYY